MEQSANNMQAPLCIMRYLLLLVLFHPFLAAHPAVAAETARIAVLTSQDSEPYQELLAGFRQSLNQQGIQVVYDISSLQGDAAKAATTIERLKHSNAALLLTLGTMATQAAVQANVETPLL